MVLVEALGFTDLGAGAWAKSFGEASLNRGHLLVMMQASSLTNNFYEASIRPQRVSKIQHRGQDFI